MWCLLGLGYDFPTCYANLFNCNYVETMDEWDQETLEKVVAAKGNEFIHNKPTEIVCIF